MVTETNDGSIKEIAIVPSKDIAVRSTGYDISAVSVMRPRDVKKAFNDAVLELQLYPEAANKAFYSIPYKNEKGGYTNVEGPSVKAAQALMRNFGNMSNTPGEIKDVDDTRIIVEGICIDHEKNVMISRKVSVAKQAWNKSTKTMTMLRGDRLNLAIMSAISKAIRNATLAALPAFLVDAYVVEAKKAIDSGKTKAEYKKQIATMLNAFLEFGIDSKQVQSYLNAMIRAIPQNEVVSHMRGVHTALKDGQMKKEDFLNVIGEVEAEKIETTGSVTNDLTGVSSEATPSN
jgi:hypothetical protein